MGVTTKEGFLSRGIESSSVQAVLSGPSELRFESVRKTFQTKGKPPFTAVKDLNLEIERGSFVCLIGPSGCGKSTLLNMAAGLDGPTAGVVEYRGAPVRQVNTDVGYMTQHHNLLPWRTVEKNISLSLEIQGVKRSERKKRVDEIIRLVGLDDSADRFPSQLSGGMQRRTALARTLIYQPTTLLMDEPFGALDAQLRLTLQRELLAIWGQQKTTVIFVTHDLEEAILLGDKVVVFGKNPGRIIHEEDIDLERPRDLVELRSEPRFMEKWERLWRLLEPQLKGGEGQ